MIISQYVYNLANYYRFLSADVCARSSSWLQDTTARPQRAQPLSTLFLCPHESFNSLQRQPPKFLKGPHPANAEALQVVLEVSEHAWGVAGRGVLESEGAAHCQERHHHATLCN